MQSTSSNSTEQGKDTVIQAQTVLQSFPSAAGSPEMGYEKLKFGNDHCLFYRAVFKNWRVFFYFHLKQYSSIFQKPVQSWNNPDEASTKHPTTFIMYLFSNCLFKGTPFTGAQHKTYYKLTVVSCTFGILQPCSKVPLQNYWQGRKFYIILELNIWKN